MQKTQSKKRKITDLSNQNLHQFFYNGDMIDSTSLILDNNNISEFSFKFVNWKSLKKLSVANNGLTKINQFECLLMLNVLDLKGNQIKKIEGLSSLLHLEWLCLSSNNIKVIENLRTNTLLCYLDLSDNCIEELGDLSFLTHLKVLLLHTNKVSSLKSIAECLPPSIHTLTMADNNLQDLTEVQLLASLPFLEDLTLFGNPFAYSFDGQYVDYKPYAISCCKNLQTLDGSPITQAEKHSANVFEAEGHLKMLQPGQHLQLSSYLLEASPGYSPKFSQAPQRSKAKEKSLSTAVNTSLLESESIHLPLICDSPPKSKTSSNDGHRPFTAPPIHFNHDARPWLTVISSSIKSSIVEGEDTAANDREKYGIVTPFPSASSPSRSLEFDRTLQRFEEHREPRGAIEITNEVIESDSKFRARFRVEEAKRSPTSSPDHVLSRKMDREFIMEGKENIHCSYIELPSENVHASVSLTADEAASLLHLAAALIQAYIRGFLQRRRYQKTLRRHKAAVKLQAVWRGYFTRKRDAKVVEIRNELKVRKLTTRICFLESKMNRAKAERKRDKVFITDAIRILLHEINLQREKWDRIEIARQREEDAKTELYEICLGLQNEIGRLQSAIETGGELLHKNRFEHHENLSLITAACEGHREGRTNAGLSQIKIAAENTSSDKMKANSFKNTDATLKTFGKGSTHNHSHFTRKSALTGDRINFVGESVTKTQLLQSEKENSSVTDLTRKDASVSSREGGNSVSKSSDVKGFSFDSFASRVSGKGLDFGFRDEKECRSKEMEGNVDIEQGVFKEGQMPALYETFDLGERGSKFSNAVKVINDDCLVKTSSDASRDERDLLKEKYDEAGNDCRKGFDGLVFASGKLEQYPATVPALSIRSERIDDVEDHQGQVDYIGCRSEVISYGTNTLEIAAPKYSGNYLKTFANGSNLELQKEQVENTGVFSDNMNTVIEVDADEIVHTNSVSCDILEVKDAASKTDGQNDVVEKLSLVALKATEACHLNEPVKEILVSSEKSIKKDHVGSKDGFFPNYKYGLFSEGHLGKPSTIANEKKRRRTLFPKVLPEENDTDTPKAKANLSADAQSTRSMFFGPILGPSEAHASDSDGTREVSDLLKAKEQSRRKGVEDVTFEGEFKGTKHIERRELYCHNREVHCDGDIRSVYREVSAYHGGLISGKQGKTDDAVMEGTNSERKSQEKGICDNQPLSGNVVEVCGQVVDNRTVETEQADAEEYIEEDFNRDQAKAEKDRSAVSRTEKVSDIVSISTNHTQISLNHYTYKGNVSHGKSEKDPNSKPLSVEAPGSDDVANDMRTQRKPEAIPSIESDHAKEITGNVDNGKRNNAENINTTYAKKTTEDSAVLGTEGETFDNDTIVALEDAVLRNTRTSTPIKDPRGSDIPQLCAEQKDATKGGHVSLVKRNLSPRLSDMPDCINSMPRIVPAEQRNKGTPQGLPMFIDQSFDSVDNNFT